MEKCSNIEIDKEFSFAKGDIIVIGCSSGPDSMALFDMLLKVREKYELFLICAHVNHNVRRESFTEAIFMRDYCNKNDVRFETMTIDKYGDDNFENEARNIRYRFFEDLVYKYNAKYLMTAHHADDLIETILMRLVRGSNMNGYSGFKSFVDMGDYYIARPLIRFTKDELIKYNEVNGIPFFIDSSNNQMKYTRNRYRKIVLPFLKDEDSLVHKKFLKFSNTLNEANKFIEKERNKAVNRVIKNGKLIISKYLELDSYIQKEILYYMIQEYYQDDLILINDRHVELIQGIIKSKKNNTSVNLPNEVVAVRSYDNLFLKKEMDELTQYEIELNEYAELPNGRSIKFVEDIYSNSNDICRLNSSEISLPLCVRTRKFGDKISLKGMNGTKKIKDIFIDSKIAIDERDLWPVVEDSMGRILWIPGLKKSKFDKKKSESYDIILKYC